MRLPSTGTIVVGSDVWTVLEAVIVSREQELQQRAEEFAAWISEQFSEEIDFTPESLPLLDGCLRQWVDMTEAYGADDLERVIPVALSVTAYVGEIIRQNLDRAAWVTTGETTDIPLPYVQVGEGLRVNLVKKSIQVLTGADSPSFAEYYRTITQMTESGTSDEQ